MNTFRECLIRDFPIKEEGLAEMVIDALANLSQEEQTRRMDELSMTYMRSGLQNPFNQQVRERVLDGQLEDYEEDDEEETEE